MGQPAARLGDMHTCPLWDGMTPHVGGPVISPGCPTVLIGGSPAGRVGDLALCNGPTDVIVQGSPTVFIGGAMAARIGDMTAHGGVIVAGCGSVLIGGGSGGSSSRAQPQESGPSTLEKIGIGAALVIGAVIGVDEVLGAGALLAEGTEMLGGGALLGEGAEAAGGSALASEGAAAAASVGDDVIAARQATARSFYESAGWSESKIADHMAGIDFTKPVDVVTLPEDETVVQHVIPGNPVGNYFAPSGTSASELGINPAGRVPTSFSPTTNVPVLRSTAAPISDTWTMPEEPFAADGGGTQYFTKNPELFQATPK